MPSPRRHGLDLRTRLQLGLPRLRTRLQLGLPRLRAWLQLGLPRLRAWLQLGLPRLRAWLQGVRLRLCARRGRGPPELRDWRQVRAVRIALAGAVLIGVTATASAALTLSYALSPVAFAALASEGFERGLRVERVAFQLGRTPRVRVEGVEIEGLGRADAAEIELRLRPLVRGEVRARRVRLKGARFVLYRAPTGELLPVFEGGAGGDLSVLPSFEASDGEVRVVQGDSLTAVVRLSSLSLGRFHDGRTARLVLSGNVSGGDGRWHTHPIRASANLVRTPERVELRDGRAYARYVGADWFSARDARARFAWRDGRIEIERLDLRAYGGRWQITGAFWLRGRLRLEVAAHADGVDVAALLSAADGHGARTDVDLGRLRMRWDPLRVPWSGGPRFELGEGRGQLRIAGGTLPGTSLLGSLVGLEPAPTPVESFSALVTLRGGRLHSEALRLVTGDYTLEAQGSVGLDRSVALEGRLDLAGDRIRASVVPTVPVSIAGTLPHVQIDTHVSRVPGSGIGAVAGAVGRTTLAAGEKVGGALGAAGRAVGALGRRVGDVFGR